MLPGAKRPGGWPVRGESELRPFFAGVGGGGPGRLGGRPGLGRGGLGSRLGDRLGGLLRVGDVGGFAIVDAEDGDGLGEVVRLVFHGAGSGGGLFDERGVLLGDLVHLRDGGGDLLDTLGLLVGGGGDLGHDVGDAFYGGDDLLHGGAGLFDQLGAALDGLDGVADERLDLLGGAGGALSEVADLAGDDGEAATLFAGSCGLDGGVEREDVGLEGDAVDDLDDVGDLARALGDGAHGDDDFADLVAALGGDVAGAVGELVGLPGVIGVLLHGGGKLFHGRGGLFKGGGLFLGTLREVGVAGGDFLGAGVDGVGGALDAGDQLLELVHGVVDGFLEDLELAVVGAVDLLSQVALGEAEHDALDLVDGADDGVEGVVHSADDLSEVALVAADVGAGVELAGQCGVGEHVGVGDQGLEVLADLLDGLVDEGFLAGELFQLGLEVAATEFAHAGHGFLLHGDVAVDHAVHALGHGAVVAGELFGGDHHVDVALVMLR